MNILDQQPVGATGVFTTSVSKLVHRLSALTNAGLAWSFQVKKYLKKNTKILTNSSFVVNEFKDHHCLRDHRHGRIEGTKLGRQVSKYAAHYPRELVNAIARAVIAHVDAEAQSQA